MSTKAMLTFSMLLTLVGVGYYYLEMHLMQSEFSYLPSYEVILKSPGYNLVSGDSVENFFADTSRLKALVREETKN